ncbi:hypothetical protein LPB41_23685 [Thalassospira sp. MA62]|nr:hypothetical protein [Thalassospira sp. MA62]
MAHKILKPRSRVSAVSVSKGALNFHSDERNEQMRKPEIVVYTDNGNAAVSKLVGTSCTIGIQCFICDADFSQAGICTLKGDWPLDACIANGDVASAKEGGKRKVLVSVGGETFTSLWKDCANHLDEFVSALADFVVKNQFDGVDIDWEHSAVFGTHEYDPVAFLTDLTLKLRSKLPSPEYIITHAPQPPYLDPNWNDGLYLKVMEKAGNAIDYLNIQYYNNEPWVGNTPEEQVIKVAGTSGSPVSPTSIVGLVEQQKIPVQKLLVGKPTTPDNAGSGMIEANALCEAILKPLMDKYGDNFGGVMGWQFAASPESTELVTDWIATVAETLNGPAE